MSAVTDRLNTALAGRYRIERHLGEGGMATVYLCEDLKHDRKVALKLLKPELAAVLGAERFVQEIKTTAALQHPHILPLFDSGTADGFLFYVMPYIQGETLREKLNRETQLGVDEAVRIARDVADALDYAHRHGVIHRDIKPENILLHDGRPMVADFGIALAVSAAAGGRMTETGLSLGTPHYMSPEQATAEKEITARSDVYSLGSVLYEMLTGNPPHTGATAQQIIMKIITESAEPVTKYRKSVPPNVAAAVAKSLEKLPADRFETSGKFAVALADASFTTGTAGMRPEAQLAKRGWLVSPVPWAAALVLALGALAWQQWRGAAPGGVTSVVRFDIPLHGDVVGNSDNVVTVSPDGRRVAYFSRVGGKRLLHVRELGLTEPRIVDGTEEATYPAFSADSRWIFYVKNLGATVWKVGVDGTAPMQVQTTSLPSFIPYGSAWAGHSFVVSFSGQVFVVPEAGGAARQIVPVPGDTVAIAARWPCPLPGGKMLLVSTSEGRTYSVPVAGGRMMRIDLNANRVVSVSDGLVIYEVDGALMAASFDASTLRVTGTPIPVEPRVRGAALSADGHAVFLTGIRAVRIAMLDSKGAVLPFDIPPQNFTHPRFSPDGKRFAVSVAHNAVDGDIYTYDVESRTASRITTGNGTSDRPEWTHDGRRVLFRRLTDNNEEFRWQPVDKSGPEELLLKVAGARTAEAMVSPDGHYLIFRTLSPKTGRDIWYKRLDGDTTTHPFEVTSFDELMPRFSPDGKWVAYVSNEASTADVFVRPFPGPGGRVQVSSGGGTEPVWAPDGKHLYYKSAADLMAATVSGGASFSVGTRERLFAGDFIAGTIHANYDVSPDGKRFMMVMPIGQSGDVTVVLNWLADVKRRMQAARDAAK